VLFYREDSSLFKGVLSTVGARVGGSWFCSAEVEVEVRALKKGWRGRPPRKGSRLPYGECWPEYQVMTTVPTPALPPKTYPLLKTKAIERRYWFRCSAGGREHSFVYRQRNARGRSGSSRMSHVHPSCFRSLCFRAASLISSSSGWGSGLLSSVRPETVLPLVLVRV